MPIKYLEKRKIYRRKWYKEYNKSEKAQVKNRKLKLKKWFLEHKKKLKCSICQESHPAIIDFHHKGDEKKENEILFMVSNGYSVEKIIEEIGKCQILCSN